MISALPIPPSLRLAAFTVDLEYDYGSRTGRFEVLRDTAGLTRLQNFFAGRRIPVSAFAVSSLLEEKPESLEWLSSVSAEVHSHTHTHMGENSAADEELRRSRDIIQSIFSPGPLGYRAPHGRVDERQIEAAGRLGYAFSSSVFPSWRPGTFNNLSCPVTPYRHDNGLLEVPCAAIRGVRLIVSISYLKLLGWPVFAALLRSFGLPPVVVIDSHLHDFLDTPAYFGLPAPLRMAWGIRRARGVELAGRLADFLARQGYEFVSMNQLVRRLTSGTEGAR